MKKIKAKNNEKINQNTSTTIKILLSSLVLLFGISSLAQNSDIDPAAANLPEDSGVFDNGTGSAPNNGDSEFNSGIRMRNPMSRGDGCSPNEMSATLSPDKKSLSILFDNFIAQAGGSTNIARATKTCNIIIPFEVPAGYRVSVVKLDYRGFMQLPVRGGGRLLSSYYFADAGTRRPYGTRVSRSMAFLGPVDNEYSVSSSLSQRPMWSECGKSFTMNIDAKIMAATNPAREDALATIDSLDVTNEEQVRYALLWRSCSERQPDPRVNQPGNDSRTNPPANDPRAREREQREKQRESRDNTCRTPNCRK
jgi:hypothetical protein